MRRIAARTKNNLNGHYLLSRPQVAIFFKALKVSEPYRQGRQEIEARVLEEFLPA
jgi:hypothetical protein